MKIIKQLAQRTVTRIMAVAVTLMAAHVAVAQENAPLPVDGAVRMGQLPNGLTYIIRHNEYPKGQADFFIAQKVGSMQEEDNQRGLAHFLEHMAFNGTTNYPDNNLREWLAAKGVMFGRDLNAYTSFDETVYNVSSVPVNGNEAIVDSCLLILKDWAGNLTLADDAINAERGVIEQEWRRSNVGSNRIIEKALPELFPGSRYGLRWPIGTMDVVLNFAPQTLRDYYHRWYRPDLQGIIVVGDVDVDAVEGKIKSMFADLSVPEGAPARVFEEVPVHQGTRGYVGADKEMQVPLVFLAIGYEALPREMRNTVAGYGQEYVMKMITTMLSKRLEEVGAKPGTAFASADLDSGELLGFVKGKEAFSLEVIGKDGDVKKALADAYRELLRAARGGFTQSEYERATADLISSLEKQVNNASTIPSTKFAREYVRHFVDNEPIPGVATELQIVNMFAQAIPVTAINQVLAQGINPDDRFLLAMLPQKEGQEIPTVADLEAVLAAVDAENIEALKDEMREDPLVKIAPVPGRITGSKELPQWGADAREWTLSNGATVVVKPTKLKDDEVLFYAVAKKGWGTNLNLLSEADVITLPYASSAINAGGYSNSDLVKYTAGKNFGLSFFLDETLSGFNGNSTVKDLPSLMELFYAEMTDPTLSPDDYTSTMDRMRSFIANAENDPQQQFTKFLLSSLHESPLQQYVTTEHLDKAKAQDMVEYSKFITSNAADFTYFFVGNFDEATLRSLVEKYIASLPANSATVVDKITFNPELAPRAGKGDHKATMKMETPQVYGAYMVIADVPYTLKNTLLSRVVSTILTERLLNKVREEMGAVYSISAYASLNRAEKPNFSISSALMFKPELAEAGLEAVKQIYASMAEGVTPAELAKAKEILLKDLKEAKEGNNVWVKGMAGYYTNGVDTVNGDEEAAATLTKADVAAFCSEVFAQGNLRSVMLMPE